MRESAAFAAGTKQGVHPARQLMLQIPKLYNGFQGKVCKDRVRKRGV